MSSAISSCVCMSKKSAFESKTMLSASVEDTEVTEESDPCRWCLLRFCNGELTFSGGSKSGVEIPEGLSLASESSVQLSSGTFMVSKLNGSSKFPP